ncbi:MAG: sigma-70 family RNA polymerase sigma factor [Acidobacteriota bacterium]
MTTKLNQSVLIVDDEVAITEGLMELLESGRIGSTSASTQAGAEQILGSAFYPVIIADLCLHSKAEGLALIDHIRDRSPRSRVVVISGHITAEVERDLLDRGVALVVRKPADGETILAAVHALLGEIESIARNEELTFEELYLTVRKRLYNIPRHRFHLSHDRAEDVIQEAWLLFMEKRGAIRSAAPWLAGTVANLSRQSIDKRCRKRETPEDESDLAGLRDESSSDIASQLSVRQALGRVDERTRMLCSLIGMEGLSYGEVSASMGMPIGSVGPLYLRAKQKVRNELSH